MLSLHLGAAVGQQRQSTSARSQPFDGVDRVIEWLKTGVTQLVVGVADLAGQRFIVQADVFQRDVRDLSTSRCQIETSDAMALGIGPVPLADTFDRDVSGDRDRRPPIRHRVRAAGLQPAGGDAAAVVQDRVVEIEKNGPRKLNQDN